MFTREHLQELSNDYTNAIAGREIQIFAAYVREGILKYARLGESKICFPILDPRNHIIHSPNGTLNKYDPGPIPTYYVIDVVKTLKKSFPDTDFFVEGKHLYVSWT